MKRVFIAVLVTLILASASVAGAQARFVVLGHKVHQQVSTGGPGGDIVAEWIKKAGVGSVEWQTLGGNNEIRDKLFREASLPSTDIQVGFVAQHFADPCDKGNVRAAGLLYGKRTDRGFCRIFSLGFAKQRSSMEKHTQSPSAMPPPRCITTKPILKSVV